MGIKKIEVYPVVLRYKEPFRISAGTTSETHNVVVRVVTDYDVVGWGESSPSKRVTDETSESVVQALDRIAPKLVGMCPLRIEQIVEAMDSKVKKNPAAKAAVDIALYDILGKTTGKPLFMLLGGYRTEVATDFTLSIKSPEEMADDAIAAVKKGFKALKVKVGVDPDEDVDRIRLIREAVGCDVRLRIDANQGWTVKEALDVLGKVEKFDVEFVEQPVPAEDLDGLRAVRKDSPMPVMADESVHSPEDAFRLIEAGAVDLINIKLMKSGGILKGKKIAEVAESAGVGCMIGCMSESAIGIAAAAHLAAGCRNIVYADLDSDLMLRDKFVMSGGAEVKGCMRTFSDADGLGLEQIDMKSLGKPLKVYK